MKNMKLNSVNNSEFFVIARKVFFISGLQTQTDIK